MRFFCLCWISGYPPGSHVVFDFIRFTSCEVNWDSWKRSDRTEVLSLLTFQANLIVIWGWIWCAFFYQASFLSKKLNVAGRRATLSIWDTAGQERFHALGPIYYRDSNGAILVYDITDEDSFQKVRCDLVTTHIKTENTCASKLSQHFVSTKIIQCRIYVNNKQRLKTGALSSRIMPQCSSICFLWTFKKLRNKLLFSSFLEYSLLYPFSAG